MPKVLRFYQLYQKLPSFSWYFCNPWAIL